MNDAVDVPERNIQELVTIGAEREGFEMVFDDTILVADEIRAILTAATTKTVEKTDEIVATTAEATVTTTGKTARNEKASKENDETAEEFPNHFANAFKSCLCFDAAAAELEKKAAQPKDESRNDDGEDAILVASEIRALLAAAEIRAT